MNIFRLIGDLSHLASFFFLIHRLLQKRTAAGISLKTQELYLLVFVTRYLDLFTSFHSLYNTVMKVIYIAASAWIVYTIRYKDPFRSTYEAVQDTFKYIEYAIAPSAVLALVFNEGHWAKQSLWHFAFEIAWAFSIWLEAIAIVPQLILLQRHRSVENITSWYVFSLGAYRGMYLVNWVYRFLMEPHYRSWVAWVAGTIQTLFYADFFYYFVLSKSSGLKTVVLPQ